MCVKFPTTKNKEAFFVEHGKIHKKPSWSPKMGGVSPTTPSISGLWVKSVTALAGTREIIHPSASLALLTNSASHARRTQNFYLPHVFLRPLLRDSLMQSKGIDDEGEASQQGDHLRGKDGQAPAGRHLLNQCWCLRPDRGRDLGSWARARAEILYWE